MVVGAVGAVGLSDEEPGLLPTAGTVPACLDVADGGAAASDVVLTPCEVSGVGEPIAVDEGLNVFARLDDD